MIIGPAHIEDAAEILTLQKIAYISEAEIYQDYAIPPMAQTIQEVSAEFQNQVFLKALENGKIIGSVRAHLREGTCFIGRLIVHPRFQNQGLGTALIQDVEKRFPRAKRFELFTGHRSERNLYLYQKLGYQEFRRQKVNESLEMVYLEKNNQLT